jgi:hypothetical protein
MNALREIVNKKMTYEDNHNERCLFCDAYISSGHAIDCLQMRAAAELIMMEERDTLQIVLIAKLRDDIKGFRESLEKIKNKSNLWQASAQNTTATKAVPPWWNLGDIAAAALKKVS